METVVVIHEEPIINVILLPIESEEDLGIFDETFDTTFE